MANRPKKTLGRAIRDDFEEENDVRFQPLKWVLWIFAAIVVISIVGYVIGWVTQPARTAAGVRENVGNANNAQAQYEKFHDLCGGIVAFDQQYETAKAAAEAHDKRTAGKEDPLGRNAEESARLHQVADGIQIARQQKAQQYNADSRKWTQDLFKSRDLPSRIDESTPSCDA